MLARATHGLTRGLPVQAVRGCLQIVLKTVFMRLVKTPVLPGSRTGVETGVGQPVITQRPI